MIKGKNNIFNYRNLKYGAVSAVITVIIIVFIILLNVTLTFLFNRFPLDIDLTKNRVFEISGDTENILSSLNQDAVIYVMNTESGFISTAPSEYFIQANEILKKYAQYSKEARVRIEYIDLMRNPDFASRYPDDQIQMNDIIVTSLDKHKVIYPSQLFNVYSSEYGNFVASSRAEQALTSALVNVISGKTFKAALVSGHGIQDIASFLDLLILNNFEITEVNLLTGVIPSDVSLLILCDPSRDLSLDELRKIDAFLDSADARVLFYIASVVQPELPNLDDFLGEWGIAVDPGIVFESDNSRLVSPSSYIAIVDYAENQHSKNMMQRNLHMLIAQSRPLRMVYEEFRSRFVTPLLKFSGASGVRPSGAPNDWVPSAAYVTGNVPALLLSTQSRNDVNWNIIHSHVLVLGSILALEESTLGNPYIANSAYFLDLIGNLTGRGDNFFITDKIIGFTDLRASYSQIITMIVIFVIILPLAVLGAGITVWLKRRYK